MSMVNCLQYISLSRPRVSLLHVAKIVVSVLLVEKGVFSSQ